MTVCGCACVCIIITNQAEMKWEMRRGRRKGNTSRAVQAGPEGRGSMFAGYISRAMSEQHPARREAGRHGGYGMARPAITVGKS